MFAKENIFKKIQRMATRTEDLTEFAKPIANELTAKTGTLKRVLSAGVMALYDMTPEQREYYMAKANGLTLEAKPETDKNLDEQIRQLVRNAAVLTKKLQDHAAANAPKRDL